MAEVYFTAAALDGDPDHPRDNYEVEQAERRRTEQIATHTNLRAGTEMRRDDEAAQAATSLPQPAMEQEQRAA